MLCGCECAECVCDAQHGEFDNQPKEVSLSGIGVSQATELDLLMSCMPVEGAPPLDALPKRRAGLLGSLSSIPASVEPEGSQQSPSQLSPVDLARSPGPASSSPLYIERPSTATGTPAGGTFLTGLMSPGGSVGGCSVGENSIGESSMASIPEVGEESFDLGEEVVRRL